MNCPNIEHPDNKKVIEALGLDAFWKIWTQNGGVIPEFVYKEANKSSGNIKSGVPELFESNPELANAVYEALGFNFRYTSEKWKDDPTKENKATYINIKGTPSNQEFQIKKDIEDGFYSVHFKTEQGKLTKEQIQTLVDAIASQIPIGGKLSTHGKITKGGISGLNRFLNNGFKKVGEREIKDREGNPIIIPILEKVKKSNLEQQAQQLYAQYLEQNPNGSVEQFKNWVDEFNRKRIPLKPTEEQLKHIKPLPKEIVDLINSWTGKPNKEILQTLKLYAEVFSKDVELENVVQVLLDNVDKIDFVKFKGIADLENKNNQAEYDAETGNIYINNIAYQPENVDIQDVIVRTVLHEYLHGYFLATLDNPKTKEEKELVEYINEAYDVLIFEYEGTDKWYGFYNVHEFVSELLSNKEFRESEQVKKTGIVQKILNFINQIFFKKYGKDSIEIKQKTFNKLLESVNILNPATVKYSERRGSLSDFISQKSQENNSFQQFQQSLNKPNTNPILQGNQKEQVKKFAELQERLNNKEFLEGAKNAYKSSKNLQEWGTQEQYNDYIARVSLGIIKNPSSGGYNYTSKVKDIVYHKTPFSFDKFEKPIEERKLNKGNKSDAIFFNFENKGFFRSKEGTKTISVIVNTTNIKVTDEKIPYATGSKEDIKNILKEDFDSIIVNKQGGKKELLVFEPEQIHILSSKADIQGFKEFVESKPLYNNKSGFASVSEALKEANVPKGISKETVLKGKKRLEEKYKGLLFTPYRDTTVDGEVTKFKVTLKEGYRNVKIQNYSIKSAFDFLKQSPEFKKLARLLESKINTDVQIKGLSTKEAIERYGAKKDFNAFYDVNNDVIVINSDKIFSNSEFAKILLEEIIHAQTARYLRMGGEKAEKFKEFFNNAQGIIRLHTGNTFDRELTNADEFLAALFYNEQFRNALKQIPSNKTFGERVKDLFSQILFELAELFGIQTMDNKNLFTDSLIGAWDIIQDSNNFMSQTSNEVFDGIELLYNDAKKASYYGDQIANYEGENGIPPTKAMKETAETLIQNSQMISLNQISHVYTDINGTVYTSVSDYYTSTDPSFFGQKDAEAEEKFANNRTWGNQIDFILEKVILGEKQDSVVNEMKMMPDLLLSQGVIEKLYDYFTEFKAQYKDCIILTQQVVFNPYTKVAGTADIIIINPEGKIKVVDLKSSIYPVGYKDGVYEEYTTVTGKKNSYNRTSSSFANRKQRHEAQLSCYKGLIESMGLKFEVDNPISVLPVQVIEETEGSGIISNVNPEPELNTLNPLSKFTEVLKRTSDIPFKESKDTTNAIDKLLITVKDRLETLEKKGLKKQEYYKLKNLLASGLETFETMSKVNTFINSVYTFLVEDTEKGYNTIYNQFNKFIENFSQMEDKQEVLNTFLEYKHLMDAYAPVMGDLKKLYQQLEIEGEVLKGNEIYSRLGSIIDSFDKMKIQYNTHIDPIIAYSLVEEVNPELRNKINKAIEENKAKYERLPQKAKDGSLGKNLLKKIEMMESSLNRGTTTEGLIDELSIGSEKDISLGDFLLTPAISSSNPLVALYVKKVKRAFENARLSSIEVAREVSNAFEEYKSKAGYSIKPSEMYAGMYQKVKRYDYKTKTFIEYMSFVQPFNETAFQESKAQMEKRVSELGDEKAKQVEREKFYKLNTQPLREEDLIVNGVTIIKGQKTLIAEKQKLVDSKIWSESELERWLNANIRINNLTGEITYSKEFSEPSSKYENPEFNKLITGTDPKSIYFRKLISKYFKSQERIPEKMKRDFALPAIPKSDQDFMLENPAEYAKFKKERLTKFGKEDEDVTIESRKTVPVLYSYDLEPGITSLDLTMSVLLYDEMSLRYEAANELLSLGEATLEKMQTAGVTKTDSLGNKIESRIAKSVGIESWNKYVKNNKGNNAAALLEVFIDTQIFNLRQNKEEVNLFGKTFDAGQIANNLMGFASFTQIGGNPLLSVANSLQANTQILIESAAKEYFTDKSIAWAKYKYYSFINDFMKDIGSPVARTFIGQLIELYDPLQGEYKDKYGRKVSKNQFLRMFNTDMWFAMQQMGEHAAAVQSMLALMYETKLKNEKGEEINLFEAYEQKAGKISLKQGVALKGNLSKDKLVSFDFQNTLHAINKRLHGVYNTFDAPTVSRYALGRLLLMYRKHVTPGFKRRFKSWSIDQELGGETEGFYMTFYKTLFTEPKELLKMLSPVGKSNLTSLEQANLKRALREQLIIFSTGAIAWLLTQMMKNMDDEERKKYAHLLYWTLRLNQEASAYGGIGDPRSMYIIPPAKDMLKSFKTPSAAYGTLERGFNLLSQLANPFEEYERNTGIWKKGDLKIWAKTTKFVGITGNSINPDEAINIMQMQK